MDIKIGIECEWEGKDGTECISKPIDITESREHQEAVIESILNEVEELGAPEFTIIGRIECYHEGCIFGSYFSLHYCECCKETCHEHVFEILDWIAFQLKFLEFQEATAKLPYFNDPPMA